MHRILNSILGYKGFHYFDVNQQVTYKLSIVRINLHYRNLLTYIELINHFDSCTATLKYCILTYTTELTLIHVLFRCNFWVSIILGRKFGGTFYPR